MSSNTCQVPPAAIMSFNTQLALSRDVNEEAEIGKRQTANNSGHL